MIRYYDRMLEDRLTSSFSKQSLGQYPPSTRSSGQASLPPREDLYPMPTQRHYDQGPAYYEPQVAHQSHAVGQPRPSAYRADHRQPLPANPVINQSAASGQTLQSYAAPAFPPAPQRVPTPPEESLIEL